MAFIGIIAERKKEMQIKKFLDNSLNSEYKQHTIIAINDKNVENIKGIRFETILIISLDEITNKKAVNDLIKNLRYLVISSDIDSRFIELNNNEKINVITFGFNQKATITASSVEEGLMMCLQRRIIDINKNYIEPQEINVKNTNIKNIKSTHNLMGISSVLLIYGKKELKI